MLFKFPMGCNKLDPIDEIRKQVKLPGGKPIPMKMFFNTGLDECLIQTRLRKAKGQYTYLQNDHYRLSLKNSRPGSLIERKPESLYGKCPSINVVKKQ
jgi:hypothetical protein